MKVRVALSAAVLVYGVCFEVRNVYAQDSFVSRRYYCASSQRNDAGDQTISANGRTCDEARQAVRQQAGSDPCRAADSDKWTRFHEEIQVSPPACPRMP